MAPSRATGATVPALLTSQAASLPRQRAGAKSVGSAARTWSRSERSSGSQMCSPPLARQTGSRRETQMMRVPGAESRSTIAWPMPREAPVTRMVRMMSSRDQGSPPGSGERSSGSGKETVAPPGNGAEHAIARAMESPGSCGAPESPIHGLPGSKAFAPDRGRPIPSIPFILVFKRSYQRGCKG
jgi:hypothetical protein